MPALNSPKQNMHAPTKAESVHCTTSARSSKYAQSQKLSSLTSQKYRIFPQGRPKERSAAWERARHLLPLTMLRSHKAVYHYGYLTLKNRTIQEHERPSPPTDVAAVFDWGLDTYFAPQDKPPLAIAMVVSVHGERTVRRYRLVLVQKAKLRLSAQVTEALTSHNKDHHLTASDFFPCSVDREYLYGYAADGYRSPLWLCAAYDGWPVLVHRQRATALYFHKALQDHKIFAIPGIHFFDAHRLHPQLLPTLERHFGPRSTVQEAPEGAEDTVQDPSSDEESTTVSSDMEVEGLTDDSPWCPPKPITPDDPSELEIASAADNLETLMNSSQPQANVFFLPDSLGALRHL